jgi:hypothetical protein
VKLAAFALCAAALAGGGAMADEILLPPAPLPRDRPAPFVYRLDKAATGTGALDIDWTDAYGRIVVRRRRPFALAQNAEIAFTLDMRRAVAMANTLHVHVSFDGAGEGHPPSEAEASFLTQPSQALWSDYRIIMWQPHTAAQYAALKAIGIDGGMVEAGRLVGGHLSTEAQTLLAGDLPWYVENIATDFYSPYHKWYADRPKNWRFLAAKNLYREDPSNSAAFIRSPSLSDPDWLRKIGERLIATVRAYRPYRPLYYSLGDEAGIAETSAFWDFDLSAYSLREMRLWLRGRYGTLAALNAEWGSDFTAWDDVVPTTTVAAMRKPGDNFADWADFKEWMDVAFARALRAGTDAVHSADPSALAALEGAQIPGWGGYDYSRLADAVDVMELYDYGDNVEIVQSLNPRLVTLTTSFRGGQAEAHRVWRELLHGSRGLVLWDERNEFVEADGNLGARGRSAVPYFSEIRRGIGALLINSTQRPAPVAILYSPESMRTQWMLDHRPKGAAWADLTAGSAYRDTIIRAARRRYLWIIEHLGVAHRFVSSRGIESGALRHEGCRVLILPHAIALSGAAAAEIHRFAEEGGTVVWDSEPGIFDEHGRRLPRPRLADLFGRREGAVVAVGKGRAVRLVPGVADHAGAPAGLIGRDALRRMADLLAAAKVVPDLSVTGTSGEAVSDAEIRVLRNGGVMIAALLRDLPNAAGRAASPASPESAVATFPDAVYAYDLRERRALGRSRQFAVTLDPAAPTLLALSGTPLPEPTISGPARLRLGETAALRFGLAGETSAAIDVLHLDVVDPAGKTVSQYSGNILAPGGQAEGVLPLALNDPPGLWTLRITDLLSGRSRQMAIEVAPPAGG